MSAAPTAMERVQESSPGVLILFAHANALSAHDRALEAAEHPNALYHLKQAVDALERAHRALVNTDGTAILKDGDPEPVDRWPTTHNKFSTRCDVCGTHISWAAKGDVRPDNCENCGAVLDNG